jgi:hypothetical protein
MPIIGTDVSVQHMQSFNLQEVVGCGSRNVLSLHVPLGLLLFAPFQPLLQSMSMSLISGCHCPSGLTLPLSSAANTALGDQSHAVALGRRMSSPSWPGD